MKDFSNRWKHPDQLPVVSVRQSIPKVCPESPPHEGPLCVGVRPPELRFFCLKHLWAKARAVKDPRYSMGDWIYADLAR